MRSQDIHKIVDVFNKQIEIDRYSRMVPLAEIASEANDYNLNIPRYIDSSEPEDIQDLHAHLHGGIPDRDIDALSAYWDAFPHLRSQLFKPNRPSYSDLAVDVNEVQQTILDSAEFKDFTSEVRDKVAAWFSAHRSSLEAINADTKPNDLITVLGDDLLVRFKPVPLLDAYDVYEQLLTYWHDTLHDDVFLIMNDGWVEAAKPRRTIDDKDRKLSEEPDLVIGLGRSAIKYKTDLIPPSLIVARYFVSDQAKINDLTARSEEASRAVEEFTEEHATEDGLLEAAIDEDKITKALATDRLKEARREGSDPDEIKALQHLIDLYVDEAGAKKAAKEAQAALDLATLKKYGDLSEADVKALVLDDKWHATITISVIGKLEWLAATLVGRIRNLGGRYAQPVSELKHVVESFDGKVEAHLKQMGLE
jgi:type I restriction enzyme M protein